MIPNEQGICFVMPQHLHKRNIIKLFNPEATVVHRHDRSIVTTAIDNTIKLVEEYYPITIKDGGIRKNKAVTEMLDYIPYEVDKDGRILLHFKNCIYDLVTDKWVN